MITESDESQEREDPVTAVWLVLVSGFVNLMLWMLIAWGLAWRAHAFAAVIQRPEETFMVASSSLHITQKSHPQPQTPQQQPQPQPVQQQRPQPEHEPQKADEPKPDAQPTELSKIAPEAPPQPKSAPKRTNAGSLAEQLAQQQVAFQREAEQINRQNSGPVSIATIDPNQRESATKSYHMNFAGNPELEGKGEGYLFPLRRWIQDGLHCYYGRYTWLYPTGGTEVANIPWPFCFPPTNDPIARGIHQFPFPLPPDGYRLPAGTSLYPIEKDVYQAWLSTQ
jgi:hypothetical protein